MGRKRMRIKKYNVGETSVIAGYEALRNISAVHIIRSFFKDISGTLINLLVTISYNMSLYAGPHVVLSTDYDLTDVPVPLGISNDRTIKLVE